jgi:D-3-phosphoglycerate dehydrogenase / 2-oxoglutarate reductase
MAKKILVTDDVHEVLMDGLKGLGFELDYEPNITNEAVHGIIGSYEGLIINSKIMVDKALLDDGVRLRFVGRVGSGMEIVDKTYAAEKGVAVLSSPEGNRNAVAEHALGMLLALSNNLTRSNKEVKDFDWQREKNRGFELMGRTIGIVGFGNTGSAFVSKLMSLGLRILVYDKYLSEGYLDTWKEQFKGSFPMQGQEWTDENWDISTIQAVDFQTLTHESDIISFHLPLTEEVKHLADTTFFNQCKKGLILLNTSRGQVVKTEDLIEALTIGKVKAAALDVFENEKTGTYTAGERAMYEQLFNFDNVIVTPHVAGWTLESKERLARVLLKRIEKALECSNFNQKEPLSILGKKSGN